MERVQILKELVELFYTLSTDELAEVAHYAQFIIDMRSDDTEIIEFPMNAPVLINL